MTDFAATVASAYMFEAGAIELGALVLEGAAVPASQVRLPLAMLNRHGLIAGATGTGKTKTLQLIAEQLSSAGVPVFVTDVKGDVSGLAVAGTPGPRVQKRLDEIGVSDWAPTAFPVEFLTLGDGGTKPGSGAHVRATVTSFGPTLLAKVLGLNDTQESCLGLVFHWADKAGLPLLDLKDLSAVVQHLVSDEGKAELASIGGLSKATAGVILRELTGLADSGADAFFGEPEFDTADLLRVTPSGLGVISAMELAGLQDRPELFSTFLMWMLADLFHDLPEVGDVDKPKLVFFLDEAHLLFTNATKDFLTAVVQTVRLIRSKGVGIFFVTQNPTDIPSEVLGQLGNRVQHALRAFKPEDADALAKTVKTFPKSPVYDVSDMLTTLGTGEAAVTVLNENGAPTPLAWTRLRPPASLMAQMPVADQEAMVAKSALAVEYGTPVDRESAYERLAKGVATAPAPQVAWAPGAGDGSPAGDPFAPPVYQQPGQQPGRQQPPVYQQPAGRAPVSSRAHEGREKAAGLMASPMAKAFMTAAAGTAGREIARSLFGTAPRRRSRRSSGFNLSSFL